MRAGRLYFGILLGTSMGLLLPAIVWTWAVHIAAVGMTPEMTARVVSLSGGALLANLVSVTLLIGETLRQGR
jgi:hypothetical protein